jgi:type I restriction enzyme, S subunit
MTLNDVCDFRGGGTPSKGVAKYWKGDVPWVSPKDMKFEVVSDSIDHISAEAIESSAASLIPKGSILLVVRSGILARTVPIAIAGRELTINQDLKALCPRETIIPRFLYYLLKSKMDVLLSRVSRGATVHRLGTEFVRSLDFFLPPLSEQARIVSILSRVSAEALRLESINKKRAATLEELKKSVLYEAFTGGL